MIGLNETANLATTDLHRVLWSIASCSTAAVSLLQNLQWSQQESEPTAHADITAGGGSKVGADLPFQGLQGAQGPRVLQHP